MVSDKKVKFVENLVKWIKEYSIVGIVNMRDLPAQQLQNMRAMLGKEGVKIVMARKKLLQLALDNSGLPDIKALKDKIKGMPALILSKDNPFTLYSTIRKKKSSAPAKAGQEAPNDIIVSAGPTSFAPGPIISELASVGIKTKVDGGKLTIINDAVVAKEGAIITAKLAETLKRLDIKPMEVGLDLVAVWENGLVFDAKQLYIDEAEYEQNFITAAQEAMNLAVEMVYLTSDTTDIILQKAARGARAVALEQNIITEDTRDEILAKAESQATSVKNEGKIEVGPAPKMAEKKVEAKVEEKKEEVKEVPKVEEKVEEVVKEQPKEEVKEEVKEEPKAEVKPSEEEIKKAMENIPSEKPDLKVKETVSVKDDQEVNQAQELLGKLQKEGTLRENNK